MLRVHVLVRFLEKEAARMLDELFIAAVSGTRRCVELMVTVFVMCRHVFVVWSSISEWVIMIVVQGRRQTSLGLACVGIWARRLWQPIPRRLCLWCEYWAAFFDAAGNLGDKLLRTTASLEDKLARLFLLTQ